MSDGTVSNGRQSDGKWRRGPRGRFLPGTRGGPGNPHVRWQAERRAALERAVTAEELGAIVARMKAQAIAGDADARRELLNRLLGRPAPVECADALGFKLRPLQTAGDVVAASNELLEALADGRISMETAERLSGLIAQARSSIEFNARVRRRAVADVREAMIWLVGILREELPPEQVTRAFRRFDREYLEKRRAAAGAQPEREVTPELPPAAGDGS